MAVVIALLALLVGIVAELLVGSAGDAALFLAAFLAISLAIMLLWPDSTPGRHLQKHLRLSMDKRLLAFGLFAVGCVAIFAKIAEDVVDRESSQLDRAVSLWIHRWDTPALDHVMKFFSLVGSFPVLMCVAVVILIWCLRRKDFAAFAGLCGVIALDETLNRILKNTFDRPRPTLFEEIATLHTYSFPSGHAMAAAANYGMMAIVVARLAPSMRGWVIGGELALAMMIGLSRIYLGVHWATDVLAGYAAGAAILFVGILWLEVHPSSRISSPPPTNPASSRSS
ncbi:MAG: phosphatase PAP2 family protein [Sphingomonas sp.]